MLRGLSLAMWPAVSCLAPTPGAAQGPPAPSASAQRSSLCPFQGPVLITRDSIGPLPLHVSVRDLLRICPSARVDSTLVRTSEDGRWPGVVVFRFDSVSVVGARRAGLLLPITTSHTLNEWKVRGTRARLPGGLSLGAPWQALSGGDESGTIRTSNGSARVRFTKWPQWEFIFPVPAGGPTGTFTLPDGRDVIPSDARPDRLMILLRPE